MTEKEYKILGVRVDNLSRKEILEKIESFLDEGKFHQIATVNPEFILEAQNNLCFRTVLGNCALNIADGFGIRCAFWRHGWHLKSRVSGADLTLEILKLANQKKLAVHLVINKDGLNTFTEVRKAILKTYPNLKISGNDLDKNTVSCSLIADRCVLFCNFGAPDQEVFLNSQKDAKIRLAMGVGGSFDFLTGKVRRAPVFLRTVGLEWLWRLFQPQPWEHKKKRLKRIWGAVVVFPIKILICQEK
ncbi:MAG: WecB/TagA/CpsF family glycosyltransferase [Parcubacteria group bacterium]|jgi:N-acetylglucosaminyldiphosphoundecaprenol N-acetyl-beta-D-mannosaminyltransferase